MTLAAFFPSNRLIGSPFETAVLNRAEHLVDPSGLSMRIDLALNEVGPLPDSLFDWVYANATTCHVKYLGLFFNERHQEFRTGGLWVGADWNVGQERAGHCMWERLLRSGGLNFYFVDTTHFPTVIEQCGFRSMMYRERRPPMCALAREELA